MAWAQSGMGDTQAALATLDTLHGPEWYDIFRPYYHSGLLAEAGGDRSAAGRYYRLAHEADDRALRIVQSWTRYLAREGRREEALQVLDEFLEVLPDHSLILAHRAEIVAGRTPSPVVASPQEGAAEVLYGIGAALGSESAEEFSAVYLQLALYLAPRHSLALLALADFFERIEDRERAIEAYERIPETSPLRRSGKIHRALNLNDLDRTDEAREELERLIAEDPSDREAIVALGNLLRGNEEFEEAAEVYSLAINQIDVPERRHWTLYYFRGISYERTDRWPQAERDFKQALALEPDQPYVLNYLGYSWVDQNVRLDEALEMIDTAVQLRPNDGYIVDSLGWAYYRLGRYEEAVRELERAVELRSEDPIINDHLGDAYWKVGRRIEARFQWSHARDLDPEPELLDEILHKLEFGLPEDEEERDRAAADIGRDAD
jgi:tetratricopeptide (TPR) repeat protein